MKNSASIKERLVIPIFSLLCPTYTRKTEGGRTFMVRTIAEWNAFDPSMKKKPSIASVQEIFN